MDLFVTYLGFLLILLGAYAGIAIFIGVLACLFDILWPEH